MVKFKFFVSCNGWKDGGYENTHFAKSEKDAEKIVADWNKEYGENRVKILEIKPISIQEFREDYTGF
jgi:hypothetical protein